MSMNKSTVMKSFNTLFFDFMDDIITIYPENKEIKFARDKFELLKKSNPSILIKFWKPYIYDMYSEQINAGDITFFIQKNYRSDFENSQEKISDIHEKTLSMIESVRVTIRDMDDTNREFSAKYIMNLSKLSEVYSTLLC